MYKSVYFNKQSLFCFQYKKSKSEKVNRRLFSKRLAKSLATAGFAFSINPFIPYHKMIKNRIKPKRLKKRDTIGLIAPGSPITDEKLNKAITNIEKMGFKVHFTKNITAKNGYLAGTDQQRLDDLHFMFNNPKIDGIWCIRGGYGCGRLLPKIDYSSIRKNPKPLIGFSDVTALLQAIYCETGLIGFHGPVAVSDFTDYTIEQFQSTLMEPKAPFQIKNAPEKDEKDNPAFQTKIINSGIAKGQITGGNLSLLASLAGTKHQLDAKNKIVFLEDIGERPYRIDRMLTQLLQACQLGEAAGITLGIFDDCEAKEGSDSLTLMETFEDRFGNLGIPVIYGFSFGHIDNQFTFPIGIEAELNTENQTVTLLETAVN
jgi:muramoyltetrapeptide carboxypeptidase